MSTNEELKQNIDTNGANAEASKEDSNAKQIPREKEEEEEDDDEEQSKGLLDQPLQVEGKRQRRTIQRMDNSKLNESVSKQFDIPKVIIQ
jgi:hypothetical protein